MNFKDYALDTAAKYDLAARESGMRNRFKLLNKAYRPIFPLLRKAKRVLDFGCGPGDFAAFLRTRTEAEIVGFDPSESQLSVARSAGLNSIRFTQDLSQETGTFNLIFNSHVIEHIRDEELAAFVAQMTSRLSPDGKIVLATPNGLNPFSYAFFMSTDRTHVRMHSPFTLNEIFRVHGLEVESVHREHPQAYDFASTAKFAVWAAISQFVKLGLHASAAGVRGLRFPMPLASSFFVVLGRKS